MGLAVIDIDGVVADVRHRLHHLEGRRAWLRFFDDAADDPLLEQGAALVADLATGHDIVWLTGRPERLRDLTLSWLATHGLPGTELHMRADGDHRPARIFKLEVLETLRPQMITAVVDDDVEVVAAAVRHGFPAVLAEWVPRSRVLGHAQDDLGRT